MLSFRGFMEKKVEKVKNKKIDNIMYKGFFRQSSVKSFKRNKMVSNFPRNFSLRIRNII